MKSKLHDKCITCGRKLTIHEHKQRGFGPECWDKVEKKDLRINFLEERTESRMLKYDCKLDSELAKAATKVENYEDDFVVVSTFRLGLSSGDKAGMKAILLGHRKKLQISIDEKLPNHIEINPLRLKKRKYVPLAYVYADGYSENYSIVCHNEWEMKVSLIDASTVWYEPIFTNQTPQKFEDADLGNLKKWIGDGPTTIYFKVDSNKLDYDFFYDRCEEAPELVRRLGDDEWRNMMDDIYPEIEELLKTGITGHTSWGFDVDLNWVRSLYRSFGLPHGFWIDKIMEAVENGMTYSDFEGTVVGKIWADIVATETYIVSEHYVDSMDIEELAISIWEDWVDPSGQIEELSKNCFGRLFEAIRKH